jgi:pimeloyl-ACP methyl ester carboxylesterase
VTPDADFWTDLYAVAVPEEVDVTVDSLRLRASIWDPSRPPNPTHPAVEVLLIHGGAETRQWWDHIAPLLRGASRIVAFDFSGHGDSDSREAYSLESWATEAAAVAAALLGPRPVLVGHSMGGLVAHLASQRTPEAYAGVVALDSPTQRTADGHAVRRDKIASRPGRTYPTEAEAVAAFKPYPPTPTAPTAVMEHIGRAAYRQVSNEWRRKFDPQAYNRPQAPDDFVQRAPVPTWWVRADDGFIDDEMADRIASALGSRGSFLLMPGAGHHLPLEQPMATAWLVSAFLQRIGLSATQARPS